MNNKAKNSKMTVAGAVGLTAAGLAATFVLANDSAADTPDSTAGEQRNSASVQQYTGPRTADAADAWRESSPAYTGPHTADAADGWRESAPADTSWTPRCLATADTAEYWIRATGHLPCEP